MSAPPPQPKSPPDRRKPSAMKSALKVLLPLGLLLGVVFAVTVFSRHVPQEEEKNQKTTDATATGPGIEFFNATRKYDGATFKQLFEPESRVSLQDVAFHGFFEPGEATHATQFWFRSRNPGRLTLRLRAVSCAACSGGRVAAIPADAARALMQMAAVSALPFGPVAGCPTGMAGAGAFFSSKLQWQAHTFQEVAGVAYDIPPAPAGDPWNPGWGILELNFKARANRRDPLQAQFLTIDENNEVVGKDTFAIDFVSAPAGDVDKSAIEVGELADNSSGQAHVVTVFSSTRAPGELPALTARVMNPGGGEVGPFVKAGAPEPVPAGELAAMAADYTAKAKQPVRVLSAYRIPVTVVGKVGDQRPDIGRLDRELWVDLGVPGTDPKKVAIRAAVIGPVALTGGATELNIGSFRHQSGASEVATLTTDRPDAALEVVAGAARPDFLDVSLKKLPDAGGRGQWQLTVRVPPNRVQGELVDGLVVLELKGPNPQRIRIPVRGRGVL